MALQTKSKDEVFEAIDKYNVRFVRIWFTDILGTPKSFAINPNELEGAFSAIVRARSNALIMLPSPMLFFERLRIVELAAAQRLPAMYPVREPVAIGGLFSYGANLADLFRRAATYVDKILKGAKPGDLSIEQPTKFDLVINLKTAKTLGITVPQTLLVRADEIIQ